MFGTEFGGCFFLPGWVAEWMVPWFVGRAGRLWGRGEEEESGSEEEGKAQIKAILFRHRRTSNPMRSRQVRQYQYQSAQLCTFISTR